MFMLQSNMMLTFLISDLCLHSYNSPSSPFRKFQDQPLHFIVLNNLCCFAVYVQHCSVETQTSHWWGVGATEFIQSTTTFSMPNRTARHSMGLLSCPLLLWLTGMRSGHTLTGKWIKPTRDFTDHATFRVKGLKHRLCR